MAKDDNLEVLVLDKYMAENYDALVRVQRDEPLTGRRRNSKAGAERKAGKLNMLEAQRYRCTDCGYRFKQDKEGKYSSATADHIIPWRYGSNFTHNKELVCQPCNQKRVDRSVVIKNILRVFGNVFDQVLTFNKDWE